MKQKELANAFDLLEPTQEIKYKIRNTINQKTEGRKPFFKRFKRPALAMTCFALASILVITACAAGGIQLFSLIYGSEVGKYEKYISDASEPVSTQNVSFTLEGVLYDGYKGIAIVSLKALNENGKELIEQFNNDIAIRIKGSYTTSGYMGSMFKYEKLNENSRKICGDHMIITTKGQQNITDKTNLSSSQFVIASLSGAFGEDKNYYKIDWFNGERELLGFQIGWTDGGEIVLTDFDISLITNTIEIDCSDAEAATPGFINPYKIVVSPMAIYVCTTNTNDLRSDDQFLVKFTDGNIYDLSDGGQYYSDNGVYQAFQEDDKRKGNYSSYGYGWIDENGVHDIHIYSYTFGELVDADTIESIIFFGVEYKLR